jgi:hypothetical protein
MSTDAVPFLASAVLAGIGAIASFAVGKRAPDLIVSLDEKHGSETEASKAPERVIPVHRSPSGIGRICVWAADCVQSSVVLAGPSVAALLLANGPTSLLGLAYLCVGGLGAGVFVYLLFADPDRYVQRTRFGVTPVGALAVSVNLVMAVVVWAAAG